MRTEGLRKLALIALSLCIGATSLVACQKVEPKTSAETKVEETGETTMVYDIPVVEPQNLSEEQLAYTYKQEFEDLVLLNSQDEEINLSSFRGKYIVMVFWASWCPDCQRELPIIQEVYDMYKDREDVEFVMVNLVGKRKSREETATSGQAYLDEHGMTLPNYRDMTQASREIYGLKNIPTTIIYNKEGEAQVLSLTPKGEKAYCYVGEIPKAVLVNALERILNQ